MYALTKKEKKIAREIFSISIEKEFEAALHNSETVLLKWKNKQAAAREIFHEMNNYLHDFRKHLARRYDALSSQDYLMIVAVILKDGYIKEEELSDFSDEAKEIIQRYNSVF